MFRAPLLLLLIAMGFAAPTSPMRPIESYAERKSQGDLEIGGELAGFPAGTTRFIRYQDLLRLPQETYTISDDSNLKRGTEIAGVSLKTLAAILGRGADMVVAICYDKYEAHYPPEYLAAHHPLLVLRIDGKERDRWPRSTSGDAMGPYLISHPEFTPAFKVLSHADEPQIPYGIMRLEFRKDAQVFGPIRPRGKWGKDSPVGQGFIIARQDCFRCHHSGAVGGTMARRSWLELAATAQQDPVKFRGIIRDPRSVNPAAKMPAQPGYDNATLNALTAYFRTFATTASTNTMRK